VLLILIFQETIHSNLYVLLPQQDEHHLVVHVMVHEVSHLSKIVDQSSLIDFRAKSIIVAQIVVGEVHHGDDYLPNPHLGGEK